MFYAGGLDVRPGHNRTWAGCHLHLLVERQVTRAEQVATQFRKKFATLFLHFKYQVFIVSWKETVLFYTLDVGIFR
jgi:hypothetical protein